MKIKEQTKKLAVRNEKEHFALSSVYTSFLLPSFGKWFGNLL
ncbi:hypothetical protein [Streptococcus pneumoniae]|nr:hypothetical protein [Streptococcus pneumoniae]